MFALYSILLTVGFILMLPLFLLRRQKYAAGFRQRFGHIAELPQNGNPVVWIHCVSVGETNAAVPLVNAVAEEFPDHRIVISTTTRTGQDLAQKIFQTQAQQIFYFPFDWKFAVRRALRKIKPDVVLIVETEIWFNFVREAAKSNVRVLIVNGRLSEKSLKNYLKIPKLMRRVLRYFELALMQTNVDAQRLLRLGINAQKVRVTGNIKYDQPPSENDNELPVSLKKRFGVAPENPLIVAASTHAPEETWIIEAFKKVRETQTVNPPRLLLAPRHPERFDEVAGLVEKSRLKLVRRSGAPKADDVSADVILLDSIGELRRVFSLAEIVFVGGSLIPHGGQNILEPANAGKAIVTGFYTMNFAEIINSFEKSEAVVKLPELTENQIPEKLAETFIELLENRDKRRKLAENAFALMENSRGATARTMKFLRPIFREAAEKSAVSSGLGGELPNSMTNAPPSKSK